MSNDGSGQRQLTIDSHNDLFPAVSADGRFIFFASDRAGAFNIWRMEIDGSKPIQLTRGVKDILPELTPDGRSLAYIVNEKGASNIWLQPLSGERPKQLTNFKPGKLLYFAWSRDGQWLAYMRHRATSDVVLLRDLK
jgi:Tol biopolymer transport system component